MLDWDIVHLNLVHHRMAHQQEEVKVEWDTYHYVVHLAERFLVDYIQDDYQNHHPEVESHLRKMSAKVRRSTTSTRSLTVFIHSIDIKIMWIILNQWWTSRMVSRWTHQWIDVLNDEKQNSNSSSFVDHSYFNTLNNIIDFSS